MRPYCYSGNNLSPRQAFDGIAGLDLWRKSGLIRKACLLVTLGNLPAHA